MTENTNNPSQLQSTDVEEVRKTERPKFESETIGKLAKALSAAQGEMKLAPADKRSHFGLYADLGSVIKTARAALAKHGLSVIQRVMIDPALSGQHQRHSLLTRLCHDSGEWIESRMHLNPAKHDIREMGSYITYVRRYCLASIIGIAGGEDDDDAISTLSEEEVAAEQKKAGIKKRISRAQASQLAGLITSLSEPLQKAFLSKVYEEYGVEKIAELPDWSFMKVYEALMRANKGMMQG